MAVKVEDILAQRFGYGPGTGQRAASPEILLEQLASVKVEADPQRQDELPKRILKASAYRKEHRDRSRTKEQKRQNRQEFLRWLNNTYMIDAHQRIAAAVGADVPFFDRLVAFWENHFTVSVDRRVAQPLAGLFVDMALRPHVLGRFEDMLLAAEFHPAMMFYLDLGGSFGPNSTQGKKRGKGLNENLAREILELHTLGVNGGYSQADVSEFAKIMTGWLVDQKDGSGIYEEGRAEPGDKKLLGRTFPGGPEDYADALRFIAAKDATARFIAHKLTRHFISETVDAKSTEKVAQAFHESGGNLLKTYQALLKLPEALSVPNAKARNDFEFVVAALRTARIPPENIKPLGRGKRLVPHQISVASLNQLQQKLWGASSPAGWTENPAEWLGPTALAERLNFVTRLVPHIRDEKALAFLDRTLASLASEQTRNVISFASSREEGIALVIASPEFNRR